GKRARAIAVDMLDKVGIGDAAERARAFPHEMSGGQLQRVLIAIAIAGRPQILIADEPTSALDVSVQRRSLGTLDDLRRELDLSVVLITHALALAEERSDSLVVLRDGEVRESGTTSDAVREPSDPYTARLFADAPALSPDRYAGRAVGRDCDAPPI